MGKIDENYRDAYQQHEKEVLNHNIDLLKNLRIEKDVILKLTEDCHIYEKMEIVPVPFGDDQDESDQYFKAIYIDQWSVGDSGDSFEGHIYAKIEENKWLKIPYAC